MEFYGDVDGTFTQFMHKKTDLSKAAMGPGERSNRCAARKCAPCPHADARPQRALRRRAGRSYAAVIEDGVIKALCVEAGPGEVQVGPRPGRAAARGVPPRLRHAARHPVAGLYWRGDSEGALRYARKQCCSGGAGRC